MIYGLLLAHTISPVSLKSIRQLVFKYQTSKVHKSVNIYNLKFQFYSIFIYEKANNRQEYIALSQESENTE